MNSIKGIIYGIPPSVNKAYIHLRSGGVILSATTKNYIIRAKEDLRKQWALSNTTFDPNKPHKLILTFYIKDLFTAGYPKKAKFKFKKKDASNFIKRVEDLIAEALNIDDSCILELSVSKKQSNVEKTEIELIELPDENSLYIENDDEIVAKPIGVETVKKEVVY